MKTGFRTIQIDPSRRMSEESNYSFATGEGVQLDKFAQVMKLVQELSGDGKPFRPEYLFNSELPEEIKLYLRNIFMQRIKGIVPSVDVSELSDDDIIKLSPRDNETLRGYAARVGEFVNFLNKGAE